MLGNIGQEESPESATPGSCKPSPEDKDSKLKVTTANLCLDNNSTPLAGRTAVLRYRRKPPSIALRVENWILHNSRNECTCDLCIANEIGVNDVRKIAIVTQKLAVRDPPFFIRWRGQCSRCGKPRYVILARRLTWA